MANKKTSKRGGMPTIGTGMNAPAAYRFLIQKKFKKALDEEAKELGLTSSKIMRTIVAIYFTMSKEER